MYNLKYQKKDGSKVPTFEYEGPIIHTMPNLIYAGQVPLSIKDIMEQRVFAWNSEDEELAQLWGGNNFNSGDGIKYHPNGKLKIVPDSKLLREINSETDLVWGGSQALEEGTFDEADGFEFTREDVREFANKYMSKKEALNNPFWQAFAQEDKTLLGEYINQVYSRTQPNDFANQEYSLGDEPQLMRIFIREDVPEFEVQRFLAFNPALLRSSVTDLGNVLLNRGSGKLIGVLQRDKKTTKLEDKLSI